MNIWKEYHNKTNDFLQDHQKQFEADLKAAGADPDEVEKILDMMFADDTYYDSASEALEDYREYHKKEEKCQK